RVSREECVDRITYMGAGPEGVQDHVMTFDIFPNRPDLYSVEGIARGLRGFLGLEAGLAVYPVKAASLDFIVDSSVSNVRPFAVGGIIRGLDLDDDLLRSIVDLQEKLHASVGRKRKKVAIGIHDLDRVSPPFTYKAVRPQSVRFTPLGLAQEMDLSEILAKHEKGREYAHLVESKRLFPIITDSAGKVLSFPPVINGILTQLTSDTRNLFLDVTGTDLEAVSGCLAILATALAERGGQIELVRTKYADKTLETPSRVELINPLGEDLTTLRSSLLPALLNIFRLNKHRELPQRIFETADVVVDARNVRHLAAAAMHHKAAFTEAKSLVLSLLRDVGRPGDVAAVEDGNFIPGRAASVLVE